MNSRDLLKESTAGILISPYMYQRVLEAALDRPAAAAAPAQHHAAHDLVVVARAADEVFELDGGGAYRDID